MDFLNCHIVNYAKHQQASVWHQNKAEIAHHSIDFHIDDKVLSDVIKADEVWEIQSASYHRLMGWHHLGENDMSAMTDHDDKVEDVVICIQLDEYTSV